MHTPPAGNLAFSAYYRDAVSALRDNRHACNLLGEPLRFQTVNLGDTENRITTEHAHVSLQQLIKTVRWISHTSV